MIKKVLLRIGDYVFVLRPVILIPVWSFFLLGAAAGLERSPVTAPGWSIPQGLACLSAIMISAYLLNQVFDLDSDRRNRKCFYLPLGLFAVRTVVLMAVSFFLIASYLYRFTESAQRLPLVFALVLAFTYSLPPLRLVARPFADLFANAAGYGALAYLIGYGAYAPLTAQAFSRAVPWVFLVGATFLYTTILDVEGDKNTGKNTTTVVIGVSRSAGLACYLACAGLVWAAAVSLLKLGDWEPALVLSLSLLVFMWGAAGIKRSSGTGTVDKKLASNVIQLVTLLVTAAAAAHRPSYLIVVVPLVIVARVYNRARFNVDYPGPARET